VIARPHPDAEPALAMLKSQGFRYNDVVDIFDAGPTVECDVDDIDAVARSRLVKAALRETGEEGGAGEATWLVSNTKFADFRAGLVRGTVAGGALALTPGQMRALGVAAGDELRIVALSPRDRH
jgi:arginine N-succinyltransferase